MIAIAQKKAAGRIPPLDFSFAIDGNSSSYFFALKQSSLAKQAAT
jgi:hypothetical protein